MPGGTEMIEGLIPLGQGFRIFPSCGALFQQKIFHRPPIYILFIWPRRRGPPLTTDKKLQNWVNTIGGYIYTSLSLSLSLFTLVAFFFNEIECKKGRTSKMQPLWISKDPCITEEKGKLIK